MTPSSTNSVQSGLRRASRKRLAYPMWIDIGDGSPPRRCQLADISDRGARLTVSSPEELPDLFALLFTVTAETGRWCRISWRSDTQVGVQFLQKPLPSASGQHTLEC